MFDHFKGMDVMQFIRKNEILQVKKVTYPQYIVNWRPENDEPWNTQITCSSDQMDYYGENKSSQKL